MSPKEKAEQLLNKYLNASFVCKGCDMPYCDIKCIVMTDRAAKECALIAVDEIIAELPSEVLDTFRGETYFIENDKIGYWEKVKDEIKRLKGYS